MRSAYWLQGNFREHVAMLRRLGAEPVEVRKPEQLAGSDGLVVPGGESTTFMRLMRLYGLDEAIRAFEPPILGTCAGMIVLDRDHLGLADVEVDRNALRPPGRELRGRPRARGGRAAAARCLHPRAAGSREPVRTSRCSPSTRASRCSFATGGSSWPRSTPS